MIEDGEKLKAGSKSVITDPLADGIGERDGNEYDNDKYESPLSNVRLNTGENQKRGKRNK
jgi:hypothetical protein